MVMVVKTLTVTPAEDDITYKEYKYSDTGVHDFTSLSN
jgi:hypothetical protein